MARDEVAVTAALEIARATVRLGGAVVLQDLSFSVGSGETVIVMGRSGSGKTTLLRALLGLERLDAGTVRVKAALANDGPRTLLPPEERGLAVVFQDLGLWPHMTVEEHLDFVLAARKVARNARAPRIAKLLERVGLQERRARRPGDLSGGERQRVAIARALVVDPVALLLDEPLSNLDVVLRDELLALMRELFEERASPVVYVTHDVRDAEALAVRREGKTRVDVIRDGRIVASGPLEALRAEPADAATKRLLR